MVEHVVLFKVKGDASPEAIEEMLSSLRDLEGQVPGVVNLTVGTNFSDRSKGFTHGLVVRFRDQDALEAYLPHPAHQAAVQDRILPIVDDFIVIDYLI